MDQSRTIVLWSAAILLPAAFFFTLVTNLPHITVVTILLLGLSAIKSKGWRISDRSIIYLTVLALAITLFGNYLAPLKQDRFGFMAIFARPNLSVPFLLFLGALAAGFRRRGHAIGMAAAAALFAFGLGGDIRLDAADRENDLLQLTSFFPWFFGGTMALSLLATLYGSRSGAKRGDWRRPVLLWSSVVAISGLIYLGYLGYRQNENLFRNLENALLRIGIRQFYRAGNSPMQFGGSPNLTQPMSAEFRAMTDLVALRAIGTQPPGYLRSRSFYNYVHGVWQSADEPLGTPLPTTISDSSHSADQLFSLVRMEKTPYLWDLFPDESLHGNVLMVPGDTVSLSLIASRVLRFRDGRIEVETFVREGGYTVFAESTDGESAMPFPDKPGEEFLRLPAQLQPVIGGIVEELKLLEFPTDAERFQKVQTFFESKFQYSLDWKGTKSETAPPSEYRPRQRQAAEEMERRFERRPGFHMGMRTVGRLAGGALDTARQTPTHFRPSSRQMDPVKYFLTEQRSAHCELFASATALILRGAGVPTRYVTGIICNEPHPSGKYFIARYGNAHAWVEAYDRQNKRWVMVDTTPPSVTTATARPDSWEEDFRSRGDFLRLAWFEVLANLRRGYLAEGTVAALSLVWSWIRFLVAHPIWGSLLGFSCGLTAWILFRRHKHRQRDCLTPERRKVQKEYRQLLRRLRRRKVVARDATPTAAELIGIVAGHPKLPPARQEELTKFLKLYLVRRYAIRD